MSRSTIANQSMPSTTILILSSTPILYAMNLEHRLLQLLLRPQLVAVSALLLAAVGRSGRQARVALAADHLLAVVLAGKGLERGFDETATETEDEVESGFLQWAQVSFLFLKQCNHSNGFGGREFFAERTAVFELLAGENQALLVWWDALLVLNLRLHIIDSVARLHLEGDSLARQGLHEAVNSALVAVTPRFSGFGALWDLHLHFERVSIESTIINGETEYLLTVCDFVTGYSTGVIAGCSRVDVQIAASGAVGEKNFLIPWQMPRL
ncbi:hypothetical protein NA57DRAFT_53813 [Rhizodiscina lignyota]|uniref:Uncharacterized protein n=1 Tax=Rhizodiscina lignyota TaxID=1504668 RepID=A0A9P4IKY6_9PEZI|nr:hypothetical protein NA57DRAFT_53813 [Rhizodiscina lignyota]